MMNNMLKFLKKLYIKINPLIKIVLIHLQFEMIHPYYDGNGRTGRVLNLMYLKLSDNIIDAMENTKKTLKDKLPKIYSKDLLELLFFKFYTKNEYIRNKLNISRQTATSYLKQLEEVGILSSEKIGKEIIYKNISLFKIAEN